MQTTSYCPEACFNGCCSTPLLNAPNTSPKSNRNSSTCAASRRSFAETTTSSIFPKTQFTDHESLPSLQESFTVFTKTYPQYHDTNQVDQIRAQEYKHLILSNHTCLDYIGIGLFSYSQLRKRQIAFSTPLPPPSSSSSSASSSQELPSLPPISHFPFFSISYKTGSLVRHLNNEVQESDLESAMKKRIFRFLNISEIDYSMVFTANRTSAFKLLAESYPFQTSNKLLTVYDYESEAVEGMINSSEKRGAQSMSAEFSWPRLRIRSAKLGEMVVTKKKNRETKRGLFVFPLHSRITGARYPYLWMSIARENRWHILIDACALGPKDMDSFGLSLFQPDFLFSSFYKIFGENPSGFGCLFVKKSTIPIMGHSSSAGIVSLVPTEKPFKLAEEIQPKDYQLASSSSFSGPILYQTMQFGTFSQNQDAIEAPKKAQEDSCDNSIVEKGNDLEIECKCLDEVDSLGLVLISNRARCLINWLVSSLTKLKHPNLNRVSLIRIYGPKIKFDRGPALAFNVFDWKGEKVEPVLVQKLADRSNISLSYGFLHHIWFSDKYSEEKGRVLVRRGSGGKGIEAAEKKVKANLGIPVVTVALGFLSNFQDMYKLWAFVAQFLDADFVEKERWRYTALNRKIIEV